MLLLTDADAFACQKAIQRIYTELAAEVLDIRPPRGEDAWLYREEQEQLSKEAEQALEDQIEQGHFSPALERTASELLARHSVIRSAVLPEQWNELVSAVARAMAEAHRRYRYQLSGSIFPFVPTDPLFASQPPETPLVEPDAGVGPTLGEAIDAFCKTNALKWTPKTSTTHRAKLRLLADCFGDTRRISTITTPDLWGFIEAAQKLRSKHHVGPNQSFLSRQTDVLDARITAVTATNILARVKSFFRWAHQRGYCSSNPAEVVAVTPPKQKKGVRTRRPFAPNELERLFSSPLFTGCASKARRFVPGDKVIKDAYFWVPILAFYTGARLGELIQLQPADLVVEGPTPHISINEDEAPGAEGKHVKTEAGVRLIPLHPEVMSLGFAEFVSQRRKSGAKHGRLFREIAYGADGQASSTFSKWFGRAMDKVGLGDPALTCHSFRHTAEDYFRASKVPKYIIDQIMGHRDTSAAGEYGLGIDIGAAHETMASLTLQIHLSALLGGKTTEASA